MQPFTLAPVGHPTVDTALDTCARGLTDTALLLGLDPSSCSAPASKHEAASSARGSASLIREAVELSSNTLTGATSDWVNDIYEKQAPVLALVVQLAGRDELGVFTPVSTSVTSAASEAAGLVADVARLYTDQRNDAAVKIEAARKDAADMPDGKAFVDQVAAAAAPSPDPRLAHAVDLVRTAVSSAATTIDGVGRDTADTGETKKPGSTIVSALKTAAAQATELSAASGSSSGASSGGSGGSSGGSSASSFGPAATVGFGSRSSRRSSGGSSDNGASSLAKRIGKFVSTGGPANEKDILSLAQKYVESNTPYVWGGGHGPEPGMSKGVRDGGVADSFGDYNKVGYDCSGLVRDFFYTLYGHDVGPTTAAEQRTMGTGVSPSEAQAGDIWSPHDGHIGVYLGDGQILEAQKSGTNLLVRNLSDSEMASSVFRRLTPSS